MPSLWDDLELPTPETRSYDTPGCYFDDYDVLLGYGSTGTAAGIHISPRSALTVPGLWRAVNLIAGDVAKLPCKVYRRLPDDRGKEEDPMHPAFRLLTSQADEDYSAFEFRKFMQTIVMLYGNSFAVIQRDARGAPFAMTPIDPMRVQVEKTLMGRIYKVFDDKGGFDVLDGSQVLHLKGISLDGVEGLPFFRMAQESLSLGLAAQRFGAVFFKNGATPQIVLETPSFLSDKARSRLTDGWRKFSGVNNQHKTVVLEEGVQAKAMGLSPESAQLTDLREHEIRDLGSWTSVPGHKLGDTTRTSFSSLEEENMSYLTEGLDGWLCTWENELSCKLLTERSKRERSHVIEFKREALVRADMETRFQAYNVALQNGFMTVNEVRARENLPALEGGDDLRLPMNMGDTDEDAGNDNSAEEDNSEREEEDNRLRSPVPRSERFGNGVPVRRHNGTH